MARTGSRNDDNVESFRSRKRKKDRQRRETDDDRNGIESAAKSTTSSSGTKMSSDYELERQRRMARLREELKQEDEDMAATLDHNDVSGEGYSAYVEDAVKPQETIIEVKEEELEGLDEEEQMRKLMGIESFGSTKGQKVEDNHKSSARGVAAKNKARRYRQYVNRKGGFDKPLDEMK